MTALPDMPFPPRQCLWCRILTRQRAIVLPVSREEARDIGRGSATAFRFPLCGFHEYSRPAAVLCLAWIFFGDAAGPHRCGPNPSRGAEELDAIGIEVFE